MPQTIFGIVTVACTRVVQVQSRSTMELAVDLDTTDERVLVSVPVVTGVHVQDRSRVVFVNLEFLTGNRQLSDSRNIVVVSSQPSLDSTEPQFPAVSTEAINAAVCDATNIVGVEVDSDAGNAPRASFEFTHDVLARFVEQILPRPGVQERGSVHFAVCHDEGPSIDGCGDHEHVSAH